jgi:hypothetical protein
MQQYFSHPKLFKIYRFQASPINMNLRFKKWKPVNNKPRGPINNVINQDHEVWNCVVIFATWTYWAKMLRHNHFTKCINQVLLIFIQNMLCNVLVEMFLSGYPCSLGMLITIHEIGLSFFNAKIQMWKWIWVYHMCSSYAML